MREILFRGKDAETGKWRYSMTIARHAYNDDEIFSYYIGAGHSIIDGKTLGQYTGLTVPSGKIFEHDVVTAKFKSNGARFNFAVKYSNEKGCYVFDNGCVKVPFCDIRSVRIIGNIHDNPALLEVGNNA